MRRAAVPVAIRHAGLSFVRLSHADHDALAASLDHDVIRRRLAARHRRAHLTRVLADLGADDAAGRSVHWAVADGVGPCGLIALRRAGDAMRTVTLLDPRVHGTGVNAEVKQLLWTAAQLLDRDLVARCHPENVQSRRALARLWPDVAPIPLRVPELRREMLVFALDDPPARGTPLPPSARAALGAQLRAQPSVADGFSRR